LAGKSGKFSEIFLKAGTFMLDWVRSEGDSEVGDCAYLQFGAFTIDLSRKSLRRGEKDIGLRPQSFDVLCYLARRAGTVVSKDELVERYGETSPRVTIR
jgi:DNA-binding response OmpR family regulator